VAFESVDRGRDQAWPPSALIGDEFDQALDLDGPEVGREGTAGTRRRKVAQFDPFDPFDRLDLLPRVEN
jgi:hypothetical protein